MKIIKPDFYDEFKCIADKCQYTCCNGWNIVIDDITMEKYMKFTGDLGDKVNNCIKTEIKNESKKHIIKLDKNGKCPLLTENGLCEIVIKKGEEYLSNACTIYPRINCSYASITEKSFYTSCPAVLDFMYKEKQIKFISEGSIDKIEVFTDDDGKLLFNSDIRNFLIDLIQLKNFPLWVKQYFVVTLMKKIEPYYKNNDFDTLNKEISKYSDINYLTKYFEMLMNVEQNYDLKFSLLKELYYEIKNKKFETIIKIIDNIDDIFKDFTDNNLIKTYEKFNNEVYSNIEYVFENCCTSNIFALFLYFTTKNFTFYEICSYIFVMYALIKFVMFIYWYINNYSINKKEQINIISVISRRFLHSNLYYKETNLFNISYLFMILR